MLLPLARNCKTIDSSCKAVIASESLNFQDFHFPLKCVYQEKSWFQSRYQAKSNHKLWTIIWFIVQNADIFSESAIFLVIWIDNNDMRDFLIGTEFVIFVTAGHIFFGLVYFPSIFFMINHFHHYSWSITVVHVSISSFSKSEFCLSCNRINWWQLKSYYE